MFPYKISVKPNNTGTHHIIDQKGSTILSGRNSHNKVVVFTDEKHQAGDYVMVKITGCTSATLKGEIIIQKAECRN